MNSIISIVFVTCLFQIFLFSKTSVYGYFGMNDYKFDIHYINKTLKSNKNVIFSEIIDHYKELEKKLQDKLENITHDKELELKEKYGANDFKDLSEPTKLCLQNTTAKWHKIYVRTIKQLQLCASDIEIKRYKIPMEQYEENLWEIASNLETIIEEQVNLNFRNRSDLSISISSYTKLKRPEMQILVNGLKNIAKDVVQLISDSKQTIVSETNMCAFSEEQKLDKKSLKITKDAEKCFSLNTSIEID